MRERLTIFSIGFDGTVCQAGTASFITPIPLKILGVSYSSGLIGGTAIVTQTGGTAASLLTTGGAGSVAVSGTIETAAVTATYKAGTAMWGTAMDNPRVPALGTVTVTVTSHTTMNGRQVANLYCLVGE